jgi:hypothetical protein
MDSVARDQAAPEHPKADAAPTLATQGNENDVHPAYDAAGVDRSLVRWMISLTPSERLQYVQGTIDLVRDVRRVPNGDR